MRFSLELYRPLHTHRFIAATTTRTLLFDAEYSYCAVCLDTTIQYVDDNQRFRDWYRTCHLIVIITKFHINCRKINKNPKCREQPDCKLPQNNIMPFSSHSLLILIYKVQKIEQMNPVDWTTYRPSSTVLRILIELMSFVSIIWLYNWSWCFWFQWKVILNFDETFPINRIKLIMVSNAYKLIRKLQNFCVSVERWEKEQNSILCVLISNKDMIRIEFWIFKLNKLNAKII